MLKSKPVLLLIILLFITFSAWAASIRGRVISPNGNPIAGATVLQVESGIRLLSDERGRFTITLKKSSPLKLKITHPAYMEKTLVLYPPDLGQGVVVKMFPYIRKREEVLVTASRYPETTRSIAAAETVISEEGLDDRMPSNIAEGIDNLPGISRIGTGGFSLVPNLRGLARRRVLILVDNARITSDRRTGPNASFISSRDIEKIEILRSPSSVFYGSDAMGGVVHILTKKPSMREGIHGGLFTKFGTSNQEKSLGFSLEGGLKNSGYYLSFQHADAGNYSSPGGEIPMSQFSQGSMLGKLYHDGRKREISLSFLGARGTDIGKANQDSREKPTWYPHERQNLFQLHWKEKEVGSKGNLDAGFFVNPNELETVKEKINTYKYEADKSKIRSLDYGFHLVYAATFGLDLRCSAGWEVSGRRGMDAFSENTSFNTAGEIIEGYREKPYQRGRRLDSGLFLASEYTGWNHMDISGGFRWDSIRLEAVPGEVPESDQSRYQAVTGFLGTSVEVSPTLIVFGNIARAYRAPSISELFYNGITGRGRIIADPNLKPETSLNLDMGIKVLKNQYFIGLYTFHYRVKNLIQRYQLMDNLYTYGNVDNGRIQGVELEWEFTPVPGWRVFGNVFAFDGESADTGSPLNDIPGARIFMGTKFWIRRFSFEISGLIQGRKSDPGPAEIEVAGYERLDFKVGIMLGASLRMKGIVANVLNRKYTPRADPQAVEAPGRSFILGLSYGF